VTSRMSWRLMLSKSYCTIPFARIPWYCPEGESLRERSRCVSFPAPRPVLRSRPRGRGPLPDLVSGARGAPRSRRRRGSRTLHRALRAPRSHSRSWEQAREIRQRLAKSDVLFREGALRGRHRAGQLFRPPSGD
jgi:hypothetical protein